MRAQRLSTMGEKSSVEGKSSTILEGSEGGEGSAAGGSTITEDSGEREGSAAVDLEGFREGVSSSALSRK